MRLSVKGAMAVLLLSASLLAGAPARAEDGTTPVDGALLHSLIAEALVCNPDVLAAQASLDAARQRVAQARDGRAFGSQSEEGIP
jgi:outer membrane protein TolC